MILSQSQKMQCGVSDFLLRFGQIKLLLRSAFLTRSFFLFFRLCSIDTAVFFNLPVLTQFFLPFHRFNYRSTHHLSTNGFYEFLNWFDERAWYPLGRIVGGTVRTPISKLCSTILFPSFLFSTVFLLL